MTVRIGDTYGGCPDSCIFPTDTSYHILLFVIEPCCPGVPLLCPVPGGMAGTGGTFRDSHGCKIYRIYASFPRLFRLYCRFIRGVWQVSLLVPYCPTLPVLPHMSLTVPCVLPSHRGKGRTPGHAARIMPCSIFRP